MPPTLKRAEDELQSQGVVVYLSSHRRWLSDNRRTGEGNPASDVGPIVEEPNVTDLQPVTEATPETTPIRERNFWLSGLVALMSFAAVIAFYCVLLEMLKSISGVSF